jgi:hypothetical protein
VNSGCVNENDLAFFAVKYTHDPKSGGLRFVGDDADFGSKYLVDER